MDHVLNSTTLRLLQRNESFANADGYYLSLNKRDWIKGAGRAIGGNKFVKRIHLDMSDGRGDDDEWLVELCRGLSGNQSIQELTLYMSKSSKKLDFFQLLTPLLEHSHKLSCIQVCGCDTSKMMFSLPSALSKWNNNQIKSFQLDKSKLKDCEGAALFKVLSQVHNLTYLRFSNTSLGQRMLRIASSDFIKISSSQLREISLFDCQLGNKTSMMLMDIIKSSKKLSCYSNSGNSSLSASWLRRTLPCCSILNLSLSGAYVSDEIITSLGDALALNKSVETLDLDCSASVTSAGWRGFCKCLRSPRTSLIDLDFTFCNIDSEGAVAIAMALRENATLQCLNMNENPLIGAMTSAQWHEFVQFLRVPRSALKLFSIEGCGIGDEGVVAIASSLADNRALTYVSLDRNWDITSVGMFAYFHLLLESETGLKHLDIDYNTVDPAAITDEEWDVLSTALCNTTTIDNTFSSNHTFHALSMERNNETDPVDDRLLTSDEYPPDQYPPYSIYYTLRMNSNPNKGEVARQKILMHHFSSGGTDVNVFASMPENVLPHAIEWIGRDKQCYALMFDFARAFPFLFTPPFAQNMTAKKRKRRK